MYVGWDGREYEDAEMTNMRRNHDEETTALDQAQLQDQPQDSSNLTPTGDRYYPAIAEAISKASKDWEYWDLGGCDGLNPYAELEAALRRGLEEMQTLRFHQHEWNENDYCDICGRDGRA